MRRAIIAADRTLTLGDAAEALGFVPGAVVEIIVTSAGSLLLCLDHSPPACDATFRPLVGGQAQLAARTYPSRSEQDAMRRSARHAEPEV